MNFLRSLTRIFRSNESDAQVVNPDGFGTFYGVFVPNVTMMFGVILFLRLGVIIGNTGLWQFATIIAISLLVMITTSLSIAMIVTNMRVGGGGVYYLISRSLGMEVGGAIGIALVLSQMITVSVCTTGFAYSLNSFLHDIFPGINVIAIEVVTLAALSFLAFASADLALKTQLLIFGLLLIGIVTVFFSKDPADVSFATEAYFPRGLKFWEAFALFYPALTGIEAGMGLSGNLKNPSRSLWLGSFLSLLFVAGVYLTIGTYLTFTIPAEDLQHSPMILLDISRIPNIIYVGIWGATLSSALGALIGGPRMFQSISEDGIVPSIFGRTFGKYQEPRYALGMTFIISLGMMVFTTIDQILPIQAMICLISYGTLNIVAGMAELIHSPRWRPTVRIPWWLSLMGGGLCAFLMFMINPMWTFIAISLVTAIYFTLRLLSLDVSFQDFRENIIFFFSRFAIYHLSKIEEHPHHWHPHFLVFSNSPTQHRNMISLASSFTRRIGLLTVASILPKTWEEEEHELDHMKKAIADYLRKIEVSCLVEAQAYSDPLDGIENLIKSYGLGSLQPNTIMLNISSEDELEGVLRAIETCKLYSKNVMLFKDSSAAPFQTFKSPSLQRKRIDIWWDNDYTGSFELILSFVHALTAGFVWKYAHINLRGVFQDESTRQHLKNYFDDFIQHSRVRLKPRLYVESDSTDPIQDLQKYSEAADLVMVPLKPIEDNPEEYKEYLSSLIEKLPEDTPFVLITSYDALDHREIYIEEYLQS